MPQRLTRTLLLSAMVLAFSGCGPQDERLQQHHEKLESLTASAIAVGKAWLSGSTSGIYTRAALEEIFTLVEDERAALASVPETLLDPRGAKMTQSAERLLGVLAAMQHDVRGSDAPSLRQRGFPTAILRRRRPRGACAAAKLSPSRRRAVAARANRSLRHRCPMQRARRRRQAPSTPCRPMRSA